MSFKSALVIPATVLLAGCLNEPLVQRDPSLGEAVKYDQAIQTINPDPVYPAGSAQPGDNGEHAVKAVEAYRKGTVKQPQTTNAGGGGAVGASAAGGGGPL